MEVKKDESILSLNEGSHVGDAAFGQNSSATCDRYQHGLRARSSAVQPRLDCAGSGAARSVNAALNVTSATGDRQPHK